MNEQTVASIVVAALAAIPGALLGIATLLQSQKNEKNSTAIGDVLKDKADQIHELTDGNLTAVQFQLKVALTRIDDLLLRIDGLEKTVSAQRSREAVTAAKHAADVSVARKKHL